MWTSGPSDNDQIIVLGLSDFFTVADFTKIWFWNFVRHDAQVFQLVVTCGDGQNTN